MDQEKLKQEAQKKLDEISSLIDDIKDQKTDNLDKIKYETLIKELDEIRDRIQEKFDRFERSGTSEGKKWDEFDKNIYGDLETFNNAYQKAGRLFKPTKGKYKSERD